ncbi:ABC transporter permease [Tenacibaculum sp. M341]|uniref:ABC transporter permease n=1 Tax=Tenacibaculum sp. M341 TaxID=2530339 RepID=UPI001046E0A6|nr:ABC transporter permease [Tenacibaculum sp. M341]TCI94760.1 FtsX-like permease family protein [Tenacibaculum sp. M341]
MNLWKIVYYNIKSKLLYTLLSIFSLALSIFLLISTQQFKSSFQHQIDNNLAGVDMVVGAKGSPLQLVLSSVLHIDNPTGNISYAAAKKIGKNPLVKFSVPISYGDNYKGYKIVGTTVEFKKLYKAEIDKGRDVQKPLEVVIGSEVAKTLSLSVGDHFLSSHGLIENDIDVHSDEFTVVGIFKPTLKVIDRLIISDLESVWEVHNHEGHADENHKEEDAHDHEVHVNESHKEEEVHDHEAHADESHKEEEAHDYGAHAHESHKEEEAHDHGAHAHESHKEEEAHADESHDDKEITSLLVSFKNPMALLSMPRKINKETNMQAAMPKFELDKLYDFMGVGFKTISFIAYLILIISGITIFISLYRMVKDRAFDLALFRTFGASNFQLIKMVFYEGIIIVISSFILAMLTLKTILYSMFNYTVSGYKLSLVQEVNGIEVLQIGLLAFVVIIFSASFALLPIIRMNISTILSNEK